MINLKPFQTQISFLYTQLRGLLNLSWLSQYCVDFTIKKYFYFFFALLSNKTWFRNGFLVVIKPSTCCTAQLILCLAFLVHAVLHFAVGLTIKYHLVPSVVFFEHIHNILVMEVLRWTRIHERAIFQAVVFTSLLVILTHVERFQNTIIFQF